MSRRACIAVCLAAFALLAFAGSAGAAIPNLGKKPWKCAGGAFQQGGSGCYGYDSGPGAMSDTQVAEMTANPDVGALGDFITIHWQRQAGWEMSSGWPSSLPGLSPTLACLATDTSCTYEVTSATNSWVVYDFGFCSFACAVDGVAYATVGEGRPISGKVTERDSHGGIRGVPEQTVSASGTHSRSAETNRQGEYTILVENGDYTVATAGRHCVKAELPTCKTSKSVSVPPSQHIDFHRDPDAKIRGTVTDADGGKVKGVTVRADEPTGERIDSAVSGADGRYELTVPIGDVKLTTDDPDVCLDPPTGDPCAKEKSLSVERDTIVNWKLKGCSRTVDFENSMIATTLGCFNKTGDQEWKIDDPFRMNGVDITPGDDVVFDKSHQTVTFPKLTWEVGGAELLTFPGGTVDFNLPNQTLAPGTGSPKGKFKGIGIGAGDFKLASEAGKSTFSISAELPYTFTSKKVENPKGCPGKAKAKLTVVTTNADGLSELGFEMEKPGEVFCVLSNPDKKGPDKSPGGYSIESVRGAYMLGASQGWWRLGGKIGGIPLFGGKNAALDVEITMDAEMHLQRLAVNASEINKVLSSPFIWLQRLGIDGGVASQGAAMQLAFKAGVSLFPSNKALGLGPKTFKFPGIGDLTVVPNEIASLDATFTYADLDHDPFTITDASLKGAGDVKVWDYPLMKADETYFPGPSAILVNGQVQFGDPSGQAFSLRGKGSGFADANRGLLYVQADGNVNFFGLAPRASHAVVNSSKGVTACVDVEGGVNWGVTWAPLSELPRVGGCDLSNFAAPIPKAAAAAAGGAVAVKPGTKLLAVEVSGSGPDGPPDLTVNGPGGARVSTARARAAATKQATVMPVVGKDRTYVVLTRPKPGTWTLKARPGSRIGRLKYAQQLPEPKLTGSVSRGCSPKVRWSVSKVAGQQLLVVDEGEDGSTKVIAENAAAKGSLSIERQVGGGERRIKVIVLQQGGLRARETIGSYDSVGDRVGSPRNLTVKRKRSAVALRWDAVCGASAYSVKVGSAKPRTVKGTSLRLAKAPTRGTVKVTSLGPAGAPGGVAARSLTT